MKTKWIIAVLGLLVIGLGLASTYLLIREKQSDLSKIAEKRFIEMMIPHHESAIEVAKQASDQATREETKALAAKIISSQQKEIDDMRRWYKDWYGSEVPKGATDPHAGHSSEPPSGTATTFDQAFIAMMIPHHESAVTMARDAKPNVYHQEIRDLADMITSSQTAEIEQMKKYQEEWKYSSSQNGSVAVTHTAKGFDKAFVTVKKGTTVSFVTLRKDQPMYVASDPHPAHSDYPQFEASYVLGDFPGIGKGMDFTFDKVGRWPYHPTLLCCLEARYPTAGGDPCRDDRFSSCRCLIVKLMS